MLPTNWLFRRNNESRQDSSWVNNHIRADRSAQIESAQRSYELSCQRDNHLYQRREAPLSKIGSFRQSWHYSVQKALVLDDNMADDDGSWISHRWFVWRVLLVQRFVRDHTQTLPQEWWGYRWHTLRSQQWRLQDQRGYQSSRLNLYIHEGPAAYRLGSCNVQQKDCQSQSFNPIYWSQALHWRYTKRARDYQRKRDNHLVSYWDRWCQKCSHPFCRDNARFCHGAHESRISFDCWCSVVFFIQIKSCEARTYEKIVNAASLQSFRARLITWILVLPRTSKGNERTRFPIDG